MTAVEGLDRPIFAATGGLVSGHNLKHLLAGALLALSLLTSCSALDPLPADPAITSELLAGNPLVVAVEHQVPGRRPGHLAQERRHRAVKGLETDPLVLMDQIDLVAELIDNSQCRILLHRLSRWFHLRSQIVTSKTSHSHYINRSPVDGAW